ncbi:hypothetical protein CR513_52074, partial [Mucuna pruriens]
MKAENLKKYLARFNSITVRVNNPDKKFFVKAFQKGLCTGQFNDLLALRRSSCMEDIRTQAEKHIKAEEDLADCLKAKCQPPTPQAKPSHSLSTRAHPKEGGYRT